MQTVSVLPLLFAMTHDLLPFQVVAVLLGILLGPSLAFINVLSGLLYPTSVRAVGAGIVGAVAIAVFIGTFPLLASGCAAAGSVRRSPTTSPCTCWRGWSPRSP